VLSNLAYLTLCRSIQLLVLLARGDAAKDLEILVLRHQLAGQCCVAPDPGHAEEATSADQMAMVSSSNAIATRRFGGFSTASS
jgi:hypothetical protein